MFTILGSQYYSSLKSEHSSKSDHHQRLRLETVETPEPSPNELGPMSGASAGSGNDYSSGFYGYSSTLPTPEISPQVRTFCQGFRFKNFNLMVTPSTLP